MDDQLRRRSGRRAVNKVTAAPVRAMRNSAMSGVPSPLPGASVLVGGAVGAAVGAAVGTGVGVAGAAVAWRVTELEALPYVPDTAWSPWAVGVQTAPVQVPPTMLKVVPAVTFGSGWEVDGLAGTALS